MANISLKTFKGQTVTPLDDAVIYDLFAGQSGIITGCVPTIKSNNLIHISAGHGIVKGRKLTMLDHDIQVALSNYGQKHQTLVLHIDLSNIEEPIKLLIKDYPFRPTQNEDMNLTNGIYQLILADFYVNETQLSNLTQVFTHLKSVNDQLVDVLSKLSELEEKTRNIVTWRAE